MMKLTLNYIIVIFIGWITVGLTNENQSDSFSGKVMLIRKSLSPHCGVIAWASKQEFKVIEGNIPRGSDNIILVKIRCPEFLGKDFFKENRIYKVVVSKNQSDSLNYVIKDINTKSKYPEYWSDGITIFDIQ